MHRERVAHRFALRQELTLRDGSAGVSHALPPSGHCLQTAAAALARYARSPLPTCARRLRRPRWRSLPLSYRPLAAAPRRRLAAPAPRNKNGGLRRPRALRIARDRHSRSAPGPALGTPREAARRGHAKRPDFPRSTQPPAARVAERSRCATASAFGLACKPALRTSLTLALARRRRAAPAPRNRTAARAARARFALREAGTAGPPGAARRSAPHAKPRGAVTPRGQTSRARYNNHRATRIAIARACATAPACGLA